MDIGLVITSPGAWGRDGHQAVDCGAQGMEGDTETQADSFWKFSGGGWQQADGEGGLKGGDFVCVSFSWET